MQFQKIVSTLPGLRTRTWLSLLVLCFFSIACWTDDVIRAHDATKRINAVIQAKMTQCSDGGSDQPALQFVITHDVQEYPLIQCESSILASFCPVSEVPAACWALYLQPAAEDVDAIF